MHTWKNEKHCKVFICCKKLQNLTVKKYSHDMLQLNVVSVAYPVLHHCLGTFQQ